MFFLLVETENRIIINKSSEALNNGIVEFMASHQKCMFAQQEIRIVVEDREIQTTKAPHLTS